MRRQMSQAAARAQRVGLLRRYVRGTLFMAASFALMAVALMLLR
jgi:hypothetical protein